MIFVVLSLLMGFFWCMRRSKTSGYSRMNKGRMTIKQAAMTVIVASRTFQMTSGATVPTQTSHISRSLDFWSRDGGKLTVGARNCLIPVVCDRDANQEIREEVTEPPKDDNNNHDVNHKAEERFGKDLME
ncbi:MAG: hypothetical protein Q9216_002286 [Gyalolechia sp. 2 TL-2023]